MLVSELIDDIRKSLNNVDTESIPNEQFITAINDAINTINAITREKTFDFLIEKINAVTDIEGWINVIGMKPNRVMKILYNGIELSPASYSLAKDNTIIILDEPLNKEGQEITLYYTPALPQVISVNDDLPLGHYHNFFRGVIRQLVIYIVKSWINEEVVEDKVKMQFALETLMGAVSGKELQNK